jgi:hypothetical protein
MLARLGLVMVTPLLVAGAVVTPQLVTTTQSEPESEPESEPVTMSDPQRAEPMDLRAVLRRQVAL